MAKTGMQMFQIDLAASIQDDSDRAYSVWVSEIMLQQTQVATVIDYYNRWIKKWPNIQKLAEASIEEVNEMWSGLGYYSRGRRLLESAQKIASTSGVMPKTSKDLIKDVAGVGRYTAGAISSIAYKEVTGVVDGNVVRVLSRLLLIGADISQQSTMEFFWEIANEIVDNKRPGDFNQAMMELGATVCTPKSPSCCKCPLMNLCSAYGKTQFLKSKKQKSLSNEKLNVNLKISDIEDVPGCNLCLQENEPFDLSLGVMNYPRKKKKKAAREEEFMAVIVERGSKFLMQQRPQKGLLAGLWEFPTIQTPDKSLPSLQNAKEIIKDDIGKRYNMKLVDKSIIYVGEVSHIFSHIHHTYYIYHGCAEENGCLSSTTCWMSKDDILSKSAVSTGIKKILKLYIASQNKSQPLKRKQTSNVADNKKQRTIDKMFTKKKVET